MHLPLYDIRYLETSLLKTSSYYIEIIEFIDNTKNFYRNLITKYFYHKSLNNITKQILILYQIMGILGTKRTSPDHPTQAGNNPVCRSLIPLLGCPDSEFLARCATKLVKTTLFHFILFYKNSVAYFKLYCIF